MYTLDGAKHSVGKGWEKLIEICYNACKSESYPVTILQVKEKWGGLRFYTSGGTDELLDLLDNAEKLSYNICEACGKAGKVREDLSWVTTLCSACYERINNGEEVFSRE